MAVAITRKIEFDAGHRIPDHGSKCRNAHGHRYVLEATVVGPVKDAPGVSDNGMVVDFGNLKGIMERAVGDKWDHAFLVYEYDPHMLGALAVLGRDHKTVILAKVPTVENLVQIAHTSILYQMKSEGYIPVQLRLRLYETPNCWADFPTDI